LEGGGGIFQTETSDWREVEEYSKRRRQIGGRWRNIPNGDVRLEGGGGIFQTETSDWRVVEEYSKRRRQIGGQWSEKLMGIN
jgi:hypothetical protein